MLYVLLGKSGSGKSIILKSLGSMYTPIITHTTRPRRDNEIDGIDYNFVDYLEMLNMKSREVGIHETYHTQYGRWEYFTKIPDDINKKDYIMIMSPKNIYNLISNNYLQKNTCMIYLKVSDNIRIDRMISRQSTLDLDNKETRRDQIKEIMRRIITDEEDFYGIEADSRINIVDNNFEVNITMKEIKQIIEGGIRRGNE